MTRTTNARTAGVAYLVYIAAGVSSMAGLKSPLITVVLTFVMAFCALTLGVALYGITRDQDNELAMLGMACRVGEGILGVQGMNMLNAAMFFAVGSTAFCWLLLRGRAIPVALAWIGLVASALLVVVLPLQIAGMISSTVAQLAFAPMAVFEIPVGIWLIVKGVNKQ